MTDAKPNGFTVADLARLYFRAQDADGSWGSVNALEATSAQFGAWVRSWGATVELADETWDTLAARADLITHLQDLGFSFALILPGALEDLKTDA